MILVAHVNNGSLLNLSQLTAYHESGHAVVAFNTAGANPIHKATITPRGVALGMVTQLPDKDETSISKRQMLARLDVCMGGRVAEEMIFGPDQVTSGARSDLQQATALARHMVCSSMMPISWVELRKCKPCEMLVPQTEMPLGDFGGRR